MRRHGLFGTRPVGPVTLVETPVSQSFARKARVAFWVVSVGVGVLATVLLSARSRPAVAVTLGALIGVVAGFAVAVVVRVWPVLRVVWHWAAEILLLVLLAVGTSALDAMTNRLVTLLVLLALVALVLVIGPVRRFAGAWIWCGVVRHRLRMCFAGFIRSANRLHPGSLPLILIARPTPAGGRVWVWLRPGLSLDDLDGKTNAIAVACWASEARVVRASSRHAALIRVDLIRRDPLAVTVGSPLPGLVPDGAWDLAAPVSPGLPPLGLDLDDIPDDPTPDPRAPRRGPRPAES